MATLSVNGVSSALWNYKRPYSPDSISINAPQVSTKKTLNTSLIDLVDLHTNNRLDHDIFASYVGLLQQQRRAQALLNQNLSSFSQTSTGRNSLLNTYQTLEYQQNSYDRIYNLKSSLFQSSLNISV